MQSDLLLQKTRMQLCFYLSLWCLALSFCSAFSTPTPDSTPKQIIPITVISGFLGSGKTTLLQNLLENKQGIKIAVIVNDVASVNIDSKLVSGGNLADGMVQLQNGCACCSLADELLGSVSELVTMSDIRGEADGQFDHIVVECSGVADPKGIRAQFQEAVFYNMPIMERVCLDTMITVVDCSVFLKHLKSSKTANVRETPELFYREGEEVPEEEPESADWMKDMPPALLQALMADKEGPAAANLPTECDNAVADLLVSQTETADIVLLNKIDLVDDGEVLETINQIVTALNPRASVSRCSFGNVPLNKILAAAGGRGVVEAGVVDDHRDAIQAADRVLDQSSAHNGAHNSHSDTHSHSHDHGCADPSCSDPSHSHVHADHEDETCNDPGCTDPTHSHSHSHSHETSSTTTDKLGITSFVYRARKPFHPGRLVAFLRYLPICRGLPEKNSDEDESQLEISDTAKESLQRVVRSKGFLWLADSNLAANYWSHSGSSFELQCLGRWWATLSRPEWPPEAVASILSDFDDKDHDDLGDPESNSVGDRRQEIVFIGPGLSSQERQEDIVSSLNQCLLDESEWELYKNKRRDEKLLRTEFEGPLCAKMLTY